MRTSNTNTEPIMIDASNLLLGKFPKPRNLYQVGWNDALQTAYDVETRNVIEGREANTDARKETDDTGDFG